MNIYTQLALVAVIVVYIVDLSGFTQSWRSLLARLAGIRPETMRPLPPFDCGQCATWWATLAWAFFTHQLTLSVTAWCAALAFLSVIIGSALVTIREGLGALINKIANWMNK